MGEEEGGPQYASGRSAEGVLSLINCAGVRALPQVSVKGSKLCSGAFRGNPANSSPYRVLSNPSHDRAVTNSLNKHQRRSVAALCYLTTMENEYEVGTSTVPLSWVYLSLTWSGRNYFEGESFYEG
jgi:hypothetical protein